MDMHDITYDALKLGFVPQSQPCMFRFVGYMRPVFKREAVCGNRV
jgi:hypothetical protein